MRWEQIDREVDRYYLRPVRDMHRNQVIRINDRMNVKSTIRVITFVIVVIAIIVTLTKLLPAVAIAIAILLITLWTTIQRSRSTGAKKNS